MCVQITWGPHLKCRFWFRESGVGPEMLGFCTLLGHADAAGLWTEQGIPNPVWLCWVTELGFGPRRSDSRDWGLNHTTRLPPSIWQHSYTMTLWEGEACSVPDTYFACSKNIKCHLAKKNECSIENRLGHVIEDQMTSFLETSWVSKSEIYM